MEALFLVFILVYSESTGSSAYNENTTDISNTTDLVVQQNFSELMESSTLSLPTPTDTLPTETDTSFPDQTGQSETTSENVPTDLPTTSTTQSAPTVAPREPHQLFSSLPSPEYSVSSLCPCNQQHAECQVNCCCDPDCTDEISLFTSCSVEKVIVNPKLCCQDVASYSLRTSPDGYASVQSSVYREVNSDVFCIQKANYDQGLSYATPEVPTDANFDSLFRQFVRFFFGTSEGKAVTTQADPSLSAGYRYGDPIQTEDEMGQGENLRLPAPAGTAYCLDANPAAFLQDQTSTCLRSFDLVNDCTTLAALSLQTYTSLQVVTGEITSANRVPVEVVSIVLQSLEGAQTPVDPSDHSSYTPQLVNPTGADSAVCNNVVLQVQYVVVYSDFGEIRNVTSAFVLGTVKPNTVPIHQTFQIEFVQESVNKPVFKFSGNPGYIVGLPLIAGTKSTDGIALSSDATAALTVIHSSRGQDCLSGSMERSPVLFGVDTVSGCTLRLKDASNCSVLYEALLGVLKGKNFPDHVASFGNSLPKYPLDWVPIQNQTTATASQECNVPLSLHLEVRWTKYGSLVNPQAQIVSVTEIIETNTSSLVLLSGANGFVPVTTSVAFVDVSAPAEPGYRAAPTIDAKLPFDFFFPFV
ncbi:tectonic-1 [Clupea harengus]|uniref:Tectonic-1 n=1 Tax=Clupea harengus TaxID=7950 RepID=A0A8M1KE53_CLUHA|nr:tectonic-1 [Clupea harengus]